MTVPGLAHHVGAEWRASREVIVHVADAAPYLPLARKERGELVIHHPCGTIPDEHQPLPNEEPEHVLLKGQAIAGDVLQIVEG